VDTLYPAFGKADQIGEVALRWLALDALILDKDRSPMHLALPPEPGTAPTILPSNIHQSAVVHEKIAVSPDLIHYLLAPWLLNQANAVVRHMGCWERKTPASLPGVCFLVARNACAHLPRIGVDVSARRIVVELSVIRIGGVMPANISALLCSEWPNGVAVQT
jgi:hypothetical protein